jgi:hypothetical protein
MLNTFALTRLLLNFMLDFGILLMMISSKWSKVLLLLEDFLKVL